MSKIKAWAAMEKGGELQPFEYDPGPLGAEEVEIAVDSCGVCHSDLSMLDNEWGFTEYPFVPGHEVIGRVTALGDQAKGLKLGQRVGLGWSARSCKSCKQCLAGRPHLCASLQGTILGRHGGFADRVRCDWQWAVPLPDGVPAAQAGPLLCGGVTVFAPLAEFAVRPTDRVGVIGIGGLGHMALQFCKAWGCEVTAFTSSEAKTDEAKSFGAHRVVATGDRSALESLAGQFDLILDTVNAPLEWDAYLAALAPLGRLHVVGAVLEPIPVPAFGLIMGQKSISGSPTGSRSMIDAMLQFAGRHQVAPKTEHYPIERVNDALEHLRAGKARYRIVLDVAG